MQFSPKARREAFLILLFLASVPLIYLLVFGSGGQIELSKQRRELQRLEQENLQLRQKNRQLLEKIQKVKTDPDEVERIAREEHNLARPGEIILTLPEKPDKPPATPKSP